MSEPDSRDGPEGQKGDRGNEGRGEGATHDQPAEAEAEARATLVEELALAFEELHLPRMAGRILGHLLVTGTEYQSLEELTAALGASKASMSTMARLLAERGYLELVPVPGGRRDHYRLRPGAWSEPTRRHAEFLKRLHSLAGRTAAPLGEASGPTGPLAQLADRVGALEQGVRALLDEK